MKPSSVCVTAILIVLDILWCPFPGEQAIVSGYFMENVQPCLKMPADNTLCLLERSEAQQTAESSFTGLFYKWHAEPSWFHCSCFWSNSPAAGLSSRPVSTRGLCCLWVQTVSHHIVPKLGQYSESTEFLTGFKPPVAPGGLISEGPSW